MAKQVSRRWLVLLSRPWSKDSNTMTTSVGKTRSATKQSDWFRCNHSYRHNRCIRLWPWPRMHAPATPEAESVLCLQTAMTSRWQQPANRRQNNCELSVAVCFLVGNFQKAVTSVNAPAGISGSIKRWKEQLFFSEAVWRTLRMNLNSRAFPSFSARSKSLIM